MKIQRATIAGPVPMIPVPTSLGGGLMPMHKAAKTPNTCTVPGCNSPSSGKCRFVVLKSSAGTCGKDVCAEHMRAAGVGAGCCPPHVRMLERRRG